MKWHPRDPSCSKSLTVNERMAAAKAKDGSTSSTLNTLKEKLRMQVRFRHATLARAHTDSQPVPAGWSKPTTVVEFLIFKSLPDARPTLVKREHQLTRATQHLIPCQRCLARVRNSRKFFGISAVTRNMIRGVSLSNRTLTFTRASREPHEIMGMISKATQSRIFWIRLSTKSLFSLIGRAGYILNPERILEPLATSGAHKEP